MKRANQVHAVLAVNQPGDTVYDTDGHLGLHRMMDIVDEAVEGIPAVTSVTGLAIPLVRLHTSTDEQLRELIRLGQVALDQAPPQHKRLEVVRFTMRHHVAWIGDPG